MGEGEPSPARDHEERAADLDAREAAVDRKERAVEEILEDAQARDEDAERRDDEAARRDRGTDLAVFLDPERTDYQEVARHHHDAALDREAARVDRSHSADDRDELVVHLDDE